MIIEKNRSEYSDVQHICQSQRTKDIKRNTPINTFSFLLIEWYDDARANREMRNNGFLWLKTISFICNQNASKSRKNVYGLSIGPKGAYHKIVKKQF